jgi:hypothetical protein
MKDKQDGCKGKYNELLEQMEHAALEGIKEGLTEYLWGEEDD